MLERKGAEADLHQTYYLGSKALLKDRVKKGYRTGRLDERLRRERTKQEALLLHKAKAIGVRVPVVYKIDRNGCGLVMEYLEGKRAKELLAQKEGLKALEGIGERIACMHKAGIIHGDLTTSNMIMCKEEPAFIDFGLGRFSKELEERAVDLLVFKKTFNATHSRIGAEGWERIIKGYKKDFKEAGKVLERLKEVEKRARYL